MPRSAAAEAGAEAAQGASAAGDSPLLYDLVAVINHLGESQHSGHYTATYRHDVACQCAGAGAGAGSHATWLHADDSRLSLVAVDEEPRAVLPAVVTPEAYMLVYRRRGEGLH
jgi:DNA-binding transcriptional LysR family regulator